MSTTVSPLVVRSRTPTLTVWTSPVHVTPNHTWPLTVMAGLSAVSVIVVRQNTGQSGVRSCVERCASGAAGETDPDAEHPAANAAASSTAPRMAGRLWPDPSRRQRSDDRRYVRVNLNLMLTRFGPD